MSEREVNPFDLFDEDEQKEQIYGEMETERNYCHRQNWGDSEKVRIYPQRMHGNNFCQTPKDDQIWHQETLRVSTFAQKGWQG